MSEPTVPAPSYEALRDAVAEVEQQVMQAERVPWATENDAATAYATTAVETAYAIDLPRLLAEARAEGEAARTAEIVEFLNRREGVSERMWYERHDAAEAVAARFNPEAEPDAE